MSNEEVTKRSKYAGVCFNCGELGHLRKNCINEERHTSKAVFFDELDKE